MIIKFNYDYYKTLSEVRYYNDNNNLFKIESFSLDYRTWSVYRFKVVYYKNNLIHRLNKPAIKFFNKKGISIYNGFYHKGNKHNSVGPAEIYSGDADFDASYFLDGKCIEKNRFLELLENKLNDN